MPSLKKLLKEDRDQVLQLLSSVHYALSDISTNIHYNRTDQQAAAVLQKNVDELINIIRENPSLFASDQSPNSFRR
jgi:hypothetical protein